MTTMTTGLVDVGAVLYDAREILVELQKANLVLSKEVGRLGGHVPDYVHELQERTAEKTAQLEALFDALPPVVLDLDDEAASAVSSSYSARRAAIEQWAATAMQYRHQFGMTDALSFAADTHSGDDFEGAGDGNNEEATDNTSDETDEDGANGEFGGPGDQSLVSDGSAFWRSGNLKWADEYDEDEFPNTSDSLLNIPELDAASESGESFTSADMVGHSGMDSGMDSDIAETVCSTGETQHDKDAMLKPEVHDPSTPRVIRGRTVSFNFKMADQNDDEEDHVFDSPTKPSKTSFSRRLMYGKAIPSRMRGLSHKGSLPNIGRLVTLQE